MVIVNHRIQITTNITIKIISLMGKTQINPLLGLRIHSLKKKKTLPNVILLFLKLIIKIGNQK